MLSPPKATARNLHLENVRERTPLRKSLLNSSLSLNQSQVIYDNESDESERNKRRSMVDIQRRLSMAGSSPVPQVAEREIKTHFQICLKMFTENRINSKNAWNLKIIDYMRTMLQSNKQGTDSLQLGSASLDVSAKVYGIRVDDIHSDGLKLASSMARIAHNPPAASDNIEGVDDSEDVENENPKAKTKKKKQKRLSASTKHTIAKDPSSLLADIPKLESAIFQTRSNADASTMDNCFTNRLLKDSSGCKFMLLSNKRVWDDDDDPTLEGDEKYPFPIEKLTNLDICADFRNFEVDVWDPDNDEVVANNASHNSELVFDDKGIPMAELDGSIHCDIFDAPDPLDSDPDEEEAPQIMFKEISSISEFKPMDNNCTSSEYLYQSMLNFNNKSMYMWAGPSHWKLKHLQRAKSKFSGATDVVKPKCAPRKNNKVQSGPIDFLKELELMQKQDERRQLPPAKKIVASQATDKYLLPAKCILPKDFSQKLTMKNIYVEAYKKKVEPSEQQTPENDEYEIGPYNYDNANDSMYCAQNNMDDNGGNNTDEEEDVVMNAQNPQYMGENLIDQVDIVAKIKMPYATHAKKMDMKKLKAAIWKCLLNETGEVTDEASPKKVQETSFSNVYGKLPSILNSKMSEELSCSLAFIAILHLANENNLKLTPKGDLSNFLIES